MSSAFLALSKEIQNSYRDTRYATYRRTIYVINQGIITRRDITKRGKVAKYAYLESPKVN